MLALAWIIIVGALMIIPGSNGPIVECIACGAMLTRVLGVISILLGVGGFLAGRSAGGGR
jgi:predicted nucleic acid-binding Zn ribbon protein